MGTQITLKDGKDKMLADLIVGKEVKEKPELRMHAPIAIRSAPSR